ncbi:hypothetical protein vseg_005485 [Gypsophila vaccaria]
MSETTQNQQLTIDPISLILSQFSDPLNSVKTFRLIADSYFMERGIKYNAYAQLRESKIRSKRLNFDEIELFSEVPASICSPPVKKSVMFDANSGQSEEKEQVSEKSVKFCEMSISENSSPVKKSVKFHGNLGEMQENVRASAIPRPNFLRKSVKFHENLSKCEENIQASEKSTSEYSSPMKKSVNFQGVKQGSSTLRKENRKPTAENNNVGRIQRAERCTTPTASSLAKRERMYDLTTKNSGRSKSVNAAEKQRMMTLGRKSYASIEELKGLSIAASNAINGETKGAKKNYLLRKSTVFSTTKFY